MMYLKFSYRGVNRYVYKDNVDEIDKVMNLGFEPVYDEAGRPVYKAFSPIKNVKPNISEDTKAFIEKLRELEKASTQVPPVCTVTSK